MNFGRAFVAVVTAGWITSMSWLIGPALWNWLMSGGVVAVVVFVLAATTIYMAMGGDNDGS